ncbi:pyridoxal 4-dehydrogenase [Caulobacter radicis]|uniref:aldo/keto reductase n=1 Tax=Caulobacter radicis TaxID=2172650 RepID=UPI000D585634|nr:aldo/keto reductase [Caulobacter radicis]PVM84496.1 pyridoxal 4-dehydrogenase [Caulobacter radicis]
MDASAERLQGSSSRLRLPRLGLGASVIGGLFRRIDDGTAQAAIKAALDGGVIYVDTAPHYGRGLSERRVGDTLRGRPDVLVSTKVGRLMMPDEGVIDDRERDGFFSAMPFSPHYDYTGDGVLRSFEASLHRLGLARIGLLLVHDIGKMVHGDRHEHYWNQLTRGGGFAALERLRDEGAIDGFGLGVNEIAVCHDAIQAAPLDAILLAGRYTLLEQTPLDRLFPACISAGVTVIAGGPYNSGILASGTRRGAAHYNYGEAPDGVVGRVRRMEELADAHGVPLAAAALQFPLAHPAVACVLPGLGDANQARQTLDWFDLAIPAEFWTEMRDEGLLRGDAPLPFH